MGRPTLIPRLGPTQGPVVAEFASRGFSTVAASLALADRLRQLGLDVRVAELGLALDPETDLRQRPLANRPRSFARLPWGGSADPFDPTWDEITAAELSALAIEPLDLQLERGATLALTSHHCVGVLGTRGRDLDLRLASEGIAHFRSERLEEAPPHSGHEIRREIFVVIAISAAELRDHAAARQLAQRYAELECDGYWVKIAGFNERASELDIDAGGRFLAALRDAAERPLVSAGCGQLHLAVLVDDLSASIGIVDREKYSGPEVAVRRRGDEPNGWAKPVYLPRQHRSLMLRKNDARRLERIFARTPCSCRAHPRLVPPNAGQLSRHTAVCRAREALDALDGASVERREWLFAEAAEATENAVENGLRPLALTSRYAALLAALDGAGEAQLPQTG